MKTIYECEICGYQSEAWADVEACESRGREAPGVAVGDIVVSRLALERGYGRFSWYDGDPAWVLGAKFGLHCQNWGEPQEYVHLGDLQTGLRRADLPGLAYAFFYVVTAITYELPRLLRARHAPYIHLETRAMSKESGYRRGWTSRQHHDVVWFPNPPLLDTADLIGVATEHLL